MRFQPSRKVITYYNEWSTETSNSLLQAITWHLPRNEKLTEITSSFCPIRYNCSNYNLPSNSWSHALHLHRIHRLRPCKVKLNTLQMKIHDDDEPVQDGNKNTYPSAGDIFDRNVSRKACLHIVRFPLHTLESFLYRYKRAHGLRPIGNWKGVPRNRFHAASTEPIIIKKPPSAILTQ